MKSIKAVLPAREAAVANGERRIGGKLLSGLPVLMLRKAERQKKTEGLQYQQVPNVPREKLKSRDSCFVKT